MNKDVKSFGTELAIMKNKAGQLGLWQTLHALDDVTKEYIKDIERIVEDEKKTK